MISSLIGFEAQEECQLLVSAASQPPPPPSPEDSPRADKKAPRRLEGTDTGDKFNHKKDTDLPQFLQELISCPPKTGEGVHYWLFKVARHLHHHQSSEDMFELLSACVEACGRYVPVSEIRAAIKDAEKCAWQPGSAQAGSKVAKWPEVNKQARQDIINAVSCASLDGLRDSSPGPCSEGGDAEHSIDMLFPGNPLLCIGIDKSSFETALRESFRGRLSDKSLIVPSPMSSLTGSRKSDGGQSAHTLENTGPRRYLVTEFDSGTADEQAAIISHLRQYGPLIMVVSSGGKSLHAWWKCEGVPDAELIKFMRYAVLLGADHMTWTRSQFVRLPGGWRADKQRRQEVLYFDPASGMGVAS